ncbi:nickel ABC transporter permease [Truepera radiovictrix]|uniref:Binding-protein-dependent transport systems inner membrane component n=1 Tax=Truepera radiovictrix (strain DSM 17093 / CIP 108686 / LMG 22925 / RQ-24) TaxID=649638 RepID=D7CUL1_TRURR|nr:nickel ABC transporter permease [Truepera radiovictrix]ADI15796.1 binding-protein-dependent transport systems inner membrane component [Truepera radiovictrix DSM 17093]WMT58576.1 ABC transporter permease [Truepera radiovictrix]
MFQYIVKRILLVIPVLFGVSILVFGIMHLSPGDPAILMLGEGAPEAELEALRARLGLNEPLHVQYGMWVGRVLQGDLGRSIRSNRLVAAEIASRLPATIELAVLATLISVAIGIPIGVLSATRPNSLLDNATMVAALGGLAMPVFWQALMMILIFSLWLGWFPSSGRLGGWEYYVLPTLTLGTSSIAAITRMTRSTMLETIRQDYVRTAHSKGVAERRVIYRHALRNALIPVVTVIGLQFGSLLAGAVLTETIFNWPGIGRLAVDAIRAQDFPVVQGVILVFAIAYALVNLLVDLTYAALDPRLRVRYG